MELDLEHFPLPLVFGKSQREVAVGSEYIPVPVAITVLGARRPQGGGIIAQGQSARLEAAAGQDATIQHRALSSELDAAL